MRRDSTHAFAIRRGIVAIVIAAVPSLEAAADRGVLSIQSDPPGASVYINGEPRGVTPLKIDRLPHGDHRVNLVKLGYLDNHRVVHLRRGDAREVQITLTRSAEARPAQVEEKKEGEKKGGGKKALWIGLGALGAGAAAYLALRETNKPPVAGLTIDSSGTALAGATRGSFSGGGSTDPDGDALTYSWNFGDGTNGTGQTTTHVYNAAGTFNVTLTVSDGKKSATADGSVNVRSLTGVWTGNLAGGTGTFFTFTLIHNGPTLSGTYSDTVNGSGTIEGVVTAPRGVSMTNRVGSFRPGFWNGSLDGAINRITGSVDWFQSGVANFALDRR